MYYVLFSYTKGQKEKGFQAFRSEDESIEFLHENYKEIEVYRIIETARSYHLGLVVTEELIKSVLEPDEKKHSLLKNREEEPSAMEKIADQVEAEIEEENLTEGKSIKLKDDLSDDEMMKENKKALEKIEAKRELTPEERTKAALEDADRLIEREKKKQEQKKKGWRLCSKCNKNRIAPHNKKGICTECQHSSEGKRKYEKRNR